MYQYCLCIQCWIYNSLHSSIHDAEADLSASILMAIYYGYFTSKETVERCTFIFNWRQIIHKFVSD